MDGSTQNSKRQEVATEFQRDSSIFILLLSTKAMGLGLNLTSGKFPCTRLKDITSTLPSFLRHDTFHKASYVIIFGKLLSTIIR